MRTLTDKVILITGATSGIGRCLALELGARGAKLALCGKSTEKLDQVVKELPQQTTHFSGAFCISEEADIVSFVGGAKKNLGPIDILINCAGVNSARASASDIATADLQWMLTVNLVAPVVFAREVFRTMRERKSGQIVNVISTVALFANEGIGAYTASKSGLDGFTKVLRKEAQHHGISVTAVYPGGVNTSFRADPKPEYLSPQTVAEAIVSLLTVEANAAVHELVLRPPVEKNFS